ncbi:MAG TPA: DMT family transporter [Candidatus Limnocylindrales bacterium]
MNRIRTGLLLAAATALISGVSIFLNAYAVKALPDAGLFTTLKNGIAAAALFAVAIPVLRMRRQPLAINRQTVGWLTVIGVIGGSIPFLLFFTGLSIASAPSAAFIQKTLFVWVALLAVPFLGERLGLLQIGALGVLFASLLLIAPPSGVTWGAGETMIAAATLLWAVEVIVARRLLAAGRVDPLVLGVGRLGIGLIVLVGYLAFTGKLALLGGLGATQWSWVLVSGVLLAGYVATWFSALRFAPATAVTSVLVLGAPITALLDAFVNGRVPGIAPLAGYGLLGAGAVLLVAALLRRRNPAAALAETTR